MVKNGNEYLCLVNGEWVETEEKVEIYSPIDNSLVGKVQAMKKDDIDNVMNCAKNALNDWKNMPIIKRASYLHKAADILNENADEIAEILAKEVSKAYNDAKTEVVRTVELIKYTAEEGLRVHGETMKGDSFDESNSNRIAVITKEPIGVVLAISPFNYPINLAASKIGPALIAGNTVVFKSATQGSVVATKLVEAFDEAGIPAGVLNYVSGRGRDIGDYLVSHPKVDFINFTGSTEVGENIGTKSGMKPLLLELGGKDAGIVLEDADLDKAAKNIVAGAFSYSGQRCTAIKRVLVLESVADELVSKLKDMVSKLTVGDPFENKDITPLIDDKAADFVWGLVEDTIKNGATVVVEPKREGNNTISPGLFDNVTVDMRLAWEEPFGPILPIIRVKSIEEAIKISNESEYGLQTAVFTQDVNKAFEIGRQLETGTVHINNKTQRGPDNFPFLGRKKSGVGVQGIRNSIEMMTIPKVLVINL